MRNEGDRIEVGRPVRGGVRIVRPWHGRPRFWPVPLRFPARSYPLYQEIPLVQIAPFGATPTRWPVSDLTTDQEVRLQAVLTRARVPWRVVEEDGEYFFTVPMQYAEALYRAVQRVKKDLPK